MIFKHTSLALGVLVLAGCTARQIVVPPNHPANPAASEAPMLPESATLRNDPQSQVRTEEGLPIAEQRHHHQQEQAAAGGSYRCPMHPDVRSETPGRCLKCGMQLSKGEGQ